MVTSHALPTWRAFLRLSLFWTDFFKLAACTERGALKPDMQSHLRLHISLCSVRLALWNLRNLILGQLHLAAQGQDAF